MVTLAVSGIPSFIPSMIELEPECSPYSVDTMQKLASRLRRENGILYFIAGGDSLVEVKSWRESEKLLTSYNFVFALRPGTDLSHAGDALSAKAVERMQDFRGLRGSEIRRRLSESSQPENGIYVVDVNAPDISATRIRDLATSGKSIIRMLPGPVYEYVCKLRLYGER